MIAPTSVMLSRRIGTFIARLVVAGDQIAVAVELGDHAVGNHVDPETLTRLERERLIDALKVIDRLRKRARADFTGAFW